MNEIIWDDTLSDNFEDRQYAIEVFNRHIEEAKEHVPAERLLVYEVKEGGEPLCEFLNVEVPEDKPFPHLNDTAVFGKMIRKRRMLTFAALTGGILLAGLALLYLLASRRVSGRA